ncbi:hypothetical protein ERJ75_001845800 [Trypanosoma vivax]|nr:hypothetical protein ERJ75_001845800 [Trypanosoma vivax]
MPLALARKSVPPVRHVRRCQFLPLLVLCVRCGGHVRSAGNTAVPPALRRVQDDPTQAAFTCIGPLEGARPTTTGTPYGGKNVTCGPRSERIPFRVSEGRRSTEQTIFHARDIWATRWAEGTLTEARGGPQRLRAEARRSSAKRRHREALHRPGAASRSHSPEENGACPLAWQSLSARVQSTSHPLRHSTNRISRRCTGTASGPKWRRACSSRARHRKEWTVAERHMRVSTSPIPSRNIKIAGLAPARTRVGASGKETHTMKNSWTSGQSRADNGACTATRWRRRRHKDRGQRAGQRCCFDGS